jgi:hypothetical protein
MAHSHTQGKNVNKPSSYLTIFFAAFLSGCSDSDIELVKENKPANSYQTYGHVFNSRNECKGADWSSESAPGGGVVVTATCEFEVEGDELKELHTIVLRSIEEDYQYIIDNFNNKKKVMDDRVSLLEGETKDWPNNSPRLQEAKSSLEQAITKREEIKSQAKESFSLHDPNARQLALDLIDWKITQSTKNIETVRDRENQRLEDVTSQLNQLTSMAKTFIDVQKDYFNHAEQRKKSASKRVDDYLGNSIKIVNSVNFLSASGSIKISDASLTLNGKSVTLGHGDGTFFGLAMLGSKQNYFAEKFKPWYMGKIRDSMTLIPDKFPYSCSDDLYIGGCKKTL